MRLSRYFSTKIEFVQFKNKIKLVPCPHCRRIGFLILRGPLYGSCYNINGDLLNRGHRYLCNNRNGRKGCGRTFSILWSYIIKYSIASAHCLWKFLSSIKQNRAKNTIFKNGPIGFTSRCGARWLEKLKKYQCAIRSNLLKKSPIPRLDSVNPLIQMLCHLKRAFIGSVCPIAAYQKHFQTSFFKN